LAIDVTTCVEVAMENGEAIFSDQKTQRVIAERIMSELKKQIEGKMILTI